MDNKNKTASQILDDAADLLTEDNRWTQGTFAKPSEPGCPMCAHTAIAYCGNPKVKTLVQKGRLLAHEITVGGAHYGLSSNINQESGSSPPANVESNPLMLAHYTAAKVGLTFAYNDNPKTKQADVVRKLRAAAQIVRNNYGV